MIFVIAQIIRLVRRIAEIYGGRPGLLGLIKLARSIGAHIAITGGMAVGDSLLQQIVGHGIASRISARMGEGVLNGLLTARVGLSALAVCRPAPVRGRQAARRLRRRAVPVQQGQGGVTPAQMSTDSIMAQAHPADSAPATFSPSGRTDQPAYTSSGAAPIFTGLKPCGSKGSARALEQRRPGALEGESSVCGRVRLRLIIAARPGALRPPAGASGAGSADAFGGAPFPGAN